MFPVPDETHVCGHGGKVLTCREAICIKFREMFEEGCVDCGKPFKPGYPYSMDNQEPVTRHLHPFVAMHHRCLEQRIEDEKR
jgi:hypothetical protein